MTGVQTCALPIFDIDIKKPEKAGLGTYTERLENGKRIQISGGLMLPWYFIVAYK